MNTSPKLVVVGRLVVLLTSAFWLGGLTFYSAVVIRVARRVLGSHLETGFITQRVTDRINVVAVVALAALLVNLIRSRRAISGRLWVMLASTWAVMAVVQLGLLALHPVMDAALDADAGSIVDGPGFYRLHRIYVIASSVQMLMGLIHAGLVLRAWQRTDYTQLHEPQEAGPAIVADASSSP